MFDDAPQPLNDGHAGGAARDLGAAAGARSPGGLTGGNTQHYNAIYYRGEAAGAPLAIEREALRPEPRWQYRERRCGRSPAVEYRGCVRPEALR